MMTFISCQVAMGECGGGPGCGLEGFDRNRILPGMIFVLPWFDVVLKKTDFQCVLCHAHQVLWDPQAL